jgi:predicted permease
VSRGTIPPRLATAFISLLSLLVPRHHRSRWREEWAGELDAAAEQARAASPLRLLALINGVLPDAIAMRRTSLQSKPRSRGSRTGPFHALDQDIRYAMRGLVAAPAFSIAICSSLALAMAANIVAFSVMNAAVFRPFSGVNGQDRLVRLNVSRAEGRGTNVASTYRDLQLLRDTVTGLSAIAAYHSTDVTISVASQPQLAESAFVTGNYFEVLGVAPAAGRTLTSRDEVDAWGRPVAVISHRFWRTAFNTDPNAIGQEILVNGLGVRVIGVGPEHFSGVEKGDYEVAVWLPLPLGELAWRDARRQPVTLSTAALPFRYVGKTRNDVSIEQVQAQSEAVARVISREYPARAGTSIYVRRVWLNDPADNAFNVVRFLIVPLFVLAIGCVNAANLLLARATRRAREWAVRIALGSSTWRLTRQILVESLVVGFVSGSAALGLTAGALRWVETYLPIPIPIDHRVLLYTVVATALTSLAFGLAPAIRASRARTSDGRFGPMGAARLGPWRFGLVVAQVALSLGLLATGTQFIKTLLDSVPSYGVPEPERVVLASFDLDPLRYTPESADDFYQRLLDDMKRRPEIAHAGLLQGAPFFSGTTSGWIKLWLPDDERPRSVLAGVVVGDVFEVMRLPIVAGQTFIAQDHTARLRSIIVNEAFVSSVLKTAGPGRVVRIADAQGGLATATEVTIQGVVASAKNKPHSLPTIYLPVPLEATPARTLMLRYRNTPGDVAGTLQQVVRKLDQRVPIKKLTTAETEARVRSEEGPLIAGGVAILGVLALLLAAGGLYGIVTYIVSLRLRELGVRMALGATRAEIVRMVLRQGLVPTAAGCVIGAGGAAAVGAVVRSRLYGASPVDPIAFGLAASVLLIAMLLASGIPARKAADVDPVVALRTE